MLIYRLFSPTNQLLCCIFNIYVAFKPFRDQRDTYVLLTYSLFKSSGITVSHFFSMLPSTLKYLYSVEPVPRNSRVQMILCAMLLYSIAHSIICTVRLFRGKMHSDWFNGIEILLDGSMEEKWDTVIAADLKSLFVRGTYMSRWSRKG